MEEFLKIEDLRLFYRTGNNIVKAVNRVSLEIEKAGQALALIGESGCGKSSLGLALLRLLPSNVADFSGKMWLDSQELFSLKNSVFRQQFRWKKIAWVPQNTKGALDPRYKIEAQFGEVFKTHGVKFTKEEMQRLLWTVGLSPEKGKAIPDRLSGGEIQRACIALAIALKPALVILDEPTSALDPSLKGQIISLLGGLKKEYSSSYVFITHDINQAGSICEWFAVLYAGQVVEKGRREDVLRLPLHPYTQKLLDCVDSFASAREPKYISGEPPALRELPDGCSFAPRCEKAGPECKEKAPGLEDKGGGHLAACYKTR
ncbi:MAG: ABC transporter ATP-binding protein [Dehalococcoidales bacterium]|jgi:oligopeptide/dipeptide ABC transporter ATP-binding protein|nr:ABC transporter ATP-binding protein [Dehalococcoidales bacterium]MDP6737989.1 ABC transporter ATP-binding protein [Dehalococcoidales bacterium]|tara:strand:+ start:4294 stop:5244 length:951 start_codon:yes stop_codon:yes gene_type:complete